MTSAAQLINEQFNESYRQIIAATVAEIDPLLIVYSTPSGGRYILRIAGKRFEAEPVPPMFAYLKSIAHAPTLLAALCGPAGSRLDDRSRLLDELAQRCRQALTEIDELPPAAEAAVIEALRGTIDQIESGIFEAGIFDESGSAGPATELSVSLRSACETLILEAGRIQAEACRNLLESWRAEIGDDAWQSMYAIVGTGWGRQEHGTHYEILCHVLGRDLLGVRLFSAMGTTGEEALLHRLGVILANRATCAVALHDPYRMDTELIGDAVVRAFQGCPGTNV
jgi:hypothetical protein